VMYLDGVAQTVTETSTPVGTLVTTASAPFIGNRSGGDRGWDGHLAEIGVWDRLLSAGEMAGLGGAPHMSPDGYFSPTYYWDLIRDLPRWGGVVLTPTGTTVQPHPPMAYPDWGHYPRAIASAPPPPPASGWGPLLAGHRHRLVAA